MRSKENPIPPVTRKEKYLAASQRLKDFPELPDRIIAGQLRVSHTFVGKIRKELIVEHKLDDTKKAYLNHPYIKLHPELLNASERTLRALRAPGVLDLMESRGIGARYAQAILRRQANEEKEKAASVLTANDIILRFDDVFSGLPWIESESLDACICDPTYDKAAVSNGLYKAIATVAARTLKPDAALVIMTGHMFLSTKTRLLCALMLY